MGDEDIVRRARARTQELRRALGEPAPAVRSTSVAPHQPLGVGAEEADDAPALVARPAATVVLAILVFLVIAAFPADTVVGSDDGEGTTETWEVTALALAAPFDVLVAIPFVALGAWGAWSLLRGGAAGRPIAYVGGSLALLKGVLHVPGVLVGPPPVVAVFLVTGFVYVAAAVAIFVMASLRSTRSYRAAKGGKASDADPMYA